MQVIKRDGKQEKFSIRKITNAVAKAYKACNMTSTRETQRKLKEEFSGITSDVISVDEIHDMVENFLMKDNPDVAKAYIIHRDDHTKIKEFVKKKIDFINKYKITKITADATIDDNSNVHGKSIGILNAEIHKEDNISVSRGMVMQKLKELYPDFDPKQYEIDLDSRIIYKHDESSFAGAIAPYCCSITMYPFLTDGIKKIGGLSARPKNLDSFCGMYVNLIFAISAQFAGAVSTPEVLLYFDYFSRKEWGNDYYKNAETRISNDNSIKHMTIRKKIHQHFQQIIYSINQPAAARGMQSAFVNFSYFDKPFFEGMFGNFYFPDGTAPIWESLCWLQKEFMTWFNEERTKCMLTFPVESFALIYKDGEFVDKDSAEFITEEYARGHSFFTYISDTVDSLSSCCFTPGTKVLWKDDQGTVGQSTLKELYDTKKGTTLWVFHNGGWNKGTPIKVGHTNFYKVVTESGKAFYMTDNHINVTSEGEKETKSLKVGDSLIFSNKALPGEDNQLTYENGFVVGSFMENGNFTMREGQNDIFITCAEQLGVDIRVNLGCEPVPLEIESKGLVSFSEKWACNLGCLTQSIEFRKGILGGWYEATNGVCHNEEVKDYLETLITSLGMNSTITYEDSLWIIDYQEDKGSEKIVTIEKILDDEEQYSYCIECENDPYFTLPNGLITHNCRLRNKIQTHEFNFTNGNMGIETGSKSVITLNLSRITQDWARQAEDKASLGDLGEYLNRILERVYKYHIAYNELLWDMYDSGLLPVYKAGFLNLNKQYLTIGLNGLNQAAEFLGIECNKNINYKNFCQLIFSTIKNSNAKTNGKYFGHTVTLNTECVPAESLAIKNYNWDKEDGYWVPEDTNLYASYVYKPNDPSISVLDKIVLHGSDYVGEYLDGELSPVIPLRKTMRVS